MTLLSHWTLSLYEGQYSCSEFNLVLLHQPGGNWWSGSSKQQVASVHLYKKSYIKKHQGKNSVAPPLTKVIVKGKRKKGRPMPRRFFFLHHSWLPCALVRMPHGSIGPAAALKSNFIYFMWRSKACEKWDRKLSVSRQLIKAQGQQAGVNTWHRECLSVALHLRCRRRCRRATAATALQNKALSPWLTLLPPSSLASLLPHLLLPASVLCFKHQPPFFSPPRLLIFTSLAQLSLSASASLF